MALFKELFLHLTGGTEENHEKMPQDSRRLDLCLDLKCTQ
jgi:hypothetical protein